MNTRSGLLILIAAVAAGVVGYLGVSGGDGAGDDTTADTAPGGGHPGVPDVRNASGQRVDGGSTPGGTPGANSADGSRAGNSADSSGPRRAVTGARFQEPVGLGMLSAEGERRVAEAVAGIRRSDAHFDDLQTLLEIEPRDKAWADAVEARISEFLRVHGAGYSGLEVARPRCTETICEIIATAVQGSGPDAPQANWQALMIRMFAEPWFNESLIDPRLTMTVRDGSVVHIATFLRRPD